MDTDDQAPATDTAPAAPDPEAPFGRREDGTPYKRDPKFFAHLRGQGGRNTKKRTPAGAKPAGPAPSRPARAGKPDYAKRIVQLGALALPLIPNVTDRKITEMMLPGWAASVERLALTYPAVAQLLDRLLLAGDGAGPAVDFVLTTVTCGGLMYLNHGGTHPMLLAMFGAQLQALQVAALQQQAADQARADELRAMLTPETAGTAPGETREPASSWAS